MIESKLRDAEQQAEKLVRDEKLTFPVDVRALAASRDIEVQAKPVDAKGVSGMLIMSGDDYAIVYATHIASTGFQRFTIAHELGHYFLPGHPEAIFRSGTVHQSHSGFGSGDQIELEADHFASGLLMPSHLFRTRAGKYSDGLGAIRNLAEDFQTSLTASAIRYARLTDASIAVVLSSGSTIDYCFVSDAMRRAKGFRHLKKGSTLPRDSATRDFNQTPANISSAKENSDDTDLNLWFHTDDEIDATEEMIGLGDYGKTLTVITADVSDDDDDGGEWDEPRFAYRR